ncbi:MAG: hypothetical protein ACRC2K_08525 [Clostridium sp.]
MIKELALTSYVENGELTREEFERICFIYSKDIEHAEENVEDLQELFETKELFEVENIIKTL